MNCSQSILETEWIDAPYDICDYVMGFVGLRPQVRHVSYRENIFICDKDWICQYDTTYQVGSVTPRVIGEFVNVHTGEAKLFTLPCIDIDVGVLNRKLVWQIDNDQHSLGLRPPTTTTQPTASPFEHTVTAAQGILVGRRIGFCNVIYGRLCSQSANIYVDLEPNIGTCDGINDPYDSACGLLIYERVDVSETGITWSERVVCDMDSCHVIDEPIQPSLVYGTLSYTVICDETHVWTYDEDETSDGGPQEHDINGYILNIVTGQCTPISTRAHRVICFEGIPMFASDKKLTQYSGACSPTPLLQLYEGKYDLSVHDGSTSVMIGDAVKYFKKVNGIIQLVDDAPLPDPRYDKPVGEVAPMSSHDWSCGLICVESNRIVDGILRPTIIVCKRP
jgi:hypothetical protein